MRVAVVNLGCKVNKVESDTIALAYASRGAELTGQGAADVIVVNTCTVTGEAEKKTRKAVRHALRANDHARVLVTGCAAAIDPEFFRGLGSRVAVVGKADLLEMHGASVPEAAQMQRVGGAFPSRVAVKAQDGCNHACTYCIVHVARGRAWSRPADEVIAESVGLARAGAGEIVLTGIDLGSYSYAAAGGRMRLGALVRELLAALERAGCSETCIRVSSIEPRSFDPDFIDVLASSEGRVCRHVHVPLQSGSSRVLAEMNRPYDADAFLELVEALRSHVPGISITTDIIVGFPGETEADFRETLRMARESAFSKIHVFRYSCREGTPAAARDDQIDPQVKEARAHELADLGDELRLRCAHEQLGKPAAIVSEGNGWGMTESYFKVRLDASVDPGRLLHATLAAVDERGIFTV